MVHPTEDWHTDGRGSSARACLVAKQLKSVNAWTDKGDPGLGAPTCEIGALGQEAVAGVDRVAAGGLGYCDDRVGIKVRTRPPPWKGKRLVGHLRMQALGIVLGVNGDCMKIKVSARAGNTNGNLAAIRNKHGGNIHEASSSKSLCSCHSCSRKGGPTH